MTYLKNLVEGQATNITAVLKLSRENCVVSLNLLKEYYNDKQLLINSHMPNLLNLKQVEDLKDVCSLRKMFDVIEIQIRSLKNLGYETSHYGPFLIPVIINKLPEELNLLISRQFSSSERWEIEQGLKVLKTEISAREKNICRFVL